MTPELEQKLFDAYPDLFQDYRLNQNETINVSDGWFDLIEEMCEELTWKFPKKVKISQIKEKFGALRVYTTIDETLQDLDAVYEVITRYENASQYICETCGKPGAIENMYMLLKATCPEHSRRLK